MTNDHLFESISQLAGLLIQHAQVRVLDAILPVHLLDEKFAVAVNDESLGAKSVSTDMIGFYRERAAQAGH